jgi:hypothetical protein
VLWTRGDDRQLAEQSARLHQRPLDRGRLLGEMYLVQGLRGGRIALYAKIHHACCEMVPDVWNLIGHLGDALEELRSL